MPEQSLRGITTGTPVPRAGGDNSRGAGPVITYQLSPEELERYRAMGKPKGRRQPLYAYEDRKGETKPVNNLVVSKEDFLRLRAQGLGRGRAGKELGLGSVQLHGKLQDWGLEHRDDELKAIDAWKQEHPAEPTAAAPDASTNPTKLTDEERKTKYLQLRANGLNRLQAFAEIDVAKGSIPYFLKKWGFSTLAAETAAVGEVAPPKEPTETGAPVEQSEAPKEPEAPIQGTAVNQEISISGSVDAAAIREAFNRTLDKPLRKDVTFTVTLEEKLIQAAFATIVEDVHETAVAHGWHENPVPLPVQLALIHSEVSEALEADRKHLGDDAVAEELADIVIRVMDTAAALNFDLAGALFRKTAQNRQREYRHGGRKY